MIDINQVQRDFDNGVMLCRETIRQVIELAASKRALPADTHNERELFTNYVTYSHPDLRTSFYSDALEFMSGTVQAMWVGWKAGRSQTEASDVSLLKHVIMVSAEEMAEVHAELGLPSDDPLDTKDMVLAIRRLKAAFHVNMYRAYPDRTHEVINEEIAKACGSKPIDGTCSIGDDEEFDKRLEEFGDMKYESGKAGLKKEHGAQAPWEDEAIYAKSQLLEYIDRWLISR